MSVARDEWQELLSSLPGTSRLQPEPVLAEAPTSRRKRRQSFRRRNRKIPYVISLNLTAMIDTIFNLLFLFIVISRFGAQEGMLPAKLPARVTQAAVAPALAVPRMPLRIRLTPDLSGPAGCRITIDRFYENGVALKELPDALRAIRNGGNGFDGNTPVHLLARDDVSWDYVVNAYNAAMTAEFSKIYFAGSP